MGFIGYIELDDTFRGLCLGKFDKAGKIIYRQQLKAFLLKFLSETFAFEEVLQTNSEAEIYANYPQYPFYHLSPKQQGLVFEILIKKMLDYGTIFIDTAKLADTTNPPEQQDRSQYVLM